jgi:hypothetical protein
MDQKRRLLEELRSKLLHRGLPRSEAARFVEELTDHLQDLMEEKECAMRMDAKEFGCLEERLGQTDELADAAVANYRHASFAGRHPVVMFLLAPIPLLAAAWIGFWYLGITAAHFAPTVLGDAYRVAGRPVNDWPASLVCWANALDYVSRMAPQMLVAGLLCHLAMRSGRGWRWGMLGCGLVAVVAGLMVTDLNLPLEGGKGRLTLGVALPPQSVWQLVQLLPPLAAGFLVLWRFNRKATGQNAPAAVA